LPGRIRVRFRVRVESVSVRRIGFRDRDSSNDGGVVLMGDGSDGAGYIPVFCSYISYI